jgi:hypothetical protein
LSDVLELALEVPVLLELPEQAVSANALAASSATAADLRVILNVPPEKGKRPPPAAG